MSYYDQVTALAPAVWFKLNEASDTPTNSGSLTCTLTKVGSPTMGQTGIQNKSVYFSGSSDFRMSNFTAGSLFGDATFSIEAWFKTPTMSSGASARTIIGARSTFDDHSFKFGIIGGTTDLGKVRFLLYHASLTDLKTTSRYDDNQWHHAVITFSPTSQKLYVDGSLQASSTITYSSPLLFDTAQGTSSGASKAIGAFDRFGTGPSVSEYFVGNIDEFAVYNSVLTSTQVYDNYIAGFNTTYAATPMTVSAEMPKVLAVHDILYNLALQRNAAYVFKLNSNINDVYCATSGHAFTSTNSGNTYIAGLTPSITGGSYKTTGTNPTIQYTESTTPIFDEIKGTTIELVFYLDSQVTDSNYKSLFSKNWTEGLAVFLNANGSGGNNLGFQIDYTNYQMFNSVDLVPGNWYHIVVEWGAKDDKLTAYINGVKYQSSGTYSYNSKHWNDTNSYSMAAAKGTTLDYIAIYNTEYNANSYLTDDDITIHYTAFVNGLNDMYNPIVFADPATASALMTSTSQSLEFIAEPFAVTASAEMVNPYEIYITMNQSEPMLAGPAEMTFPQNLGTVNLYAIPLEAFIAIVDPTITAIDNELYLPQPMAASALMPPADWSHDSGLDASHMYAEASMVEPSIDIAGRVRANTMVAGDAILISPTEETFGNVRFEAIALTAVAFTPTPPAYILLTDDDWFNRLYAIHSVKRIQSVQTYGTGTNLPNQPTKEYAKGSLLFFNDLLNIVKANTTDKITNTLPKYLFEDIKYDTNGDPIVGDVTKGFYYGKNSQGGINPTPGVFPGSFDAWGRKAVNFKNIEFNLGDELPGAYRPNYSVEFTIKTTKSNQIISWGKWASQQYAQRSYGTIGLYNGKLYTMESYQVIGGATIWPHPTNADALAKAKINSTQYALGNKRIDDGYWHHIIIQAGFDNRMQIWIDGKLDKQIIASNPSGRGSIGHIPGSNQIMNLRPYMLGYNSTDSLYSDFETSGYSWSPATFLLERDINLNSAAAMKFEPIKVQPMIASAAEMIKPKAKGNRARALMLYFWPTNQNGTWKLPPVNHSADQGPIGSLDTDTFASLSTYDYVKAPPQKYFGWDIFPVDVLGRYASELVRPEAYGGAENIVLKNSSQNVLTGLESTAQWMENIRGSYRDANTDAPRYLDIVNDIDLSQFDAIFFRDYPDQSKELDAFARNEISDPWAGTIEKTLYENFLISLRAALDTGISLYITNSQLAKDLGIIKYPEIIPSLMGPFQDTYSEFLAKRDGLSADNNYDYNDPSYDIYGFEDTHTNNFFKVINEFKGITDIPGYMLKDALLWRCSAEQQWKGIRDKRYEQYIWKDQLVPGDTFMMSDWTYNSTMPDPKYNFSGDKTQYEAVHKDNILAGTPIFGFADTYMRGSEITANPYKDYVQTIALSPGTMLGGKPIASRVYVNFTERIQESRDYGQVDIISDEWINLAYKTGRYTLDQKNKALVADYNLDRQIEAEIAGLNRPNEIARLNALKSWSRNSDNVNTFGRQIDGAGTGGGSSVNNQLVQEKSTKNVKIANTYSQAGWDGGLFFTFTWSAKYPQMVINLLNNLTRGFNWLSTREEDMGTVNREPAMLAHGEMLSPIVVADKDRTVYAPALVASAKIVTAIGYSAADYQERPVPMTAYGVFSQYSNVIYPSVMTANASLKTNIKLSAVETDQVVVYLHHIDPVIYLRGEVIK